MSLAPQRSRSWGGSSGDFEFGWGEGGGPPPVAGIEPGAKHDASATNFSPALIAMFIVLGSAFLVVSYYKIFYKFCKPCRRRPRRRGFESEDQLQDYSPGGLIFQDTDGWQLFSSNNYGLDESIIKSIPVCIFKREDKFIDGVECSVCLLEFKEKETLRVLPKCSHAFHVSCIDVWLRSHANCPLCRASVVVNIQSPFVPAMAGRIRPNLDHGMAGVVHDSFRSEQEAAVAEAAVNSRTTSDLQHVTDSQRDADVCIDLEGPEVVADVNLEDSSENFLNSKPVLARSYSFSCSGNEHYNRDSTVNTEFPLDSLLLTENSAASPWKKAFKRFNSPFNSKGGGLFSLKSPFFNRNRRGSASSSSTNNFSSMLMFPLSPARDHYTRRSARDFRHSGGSTRIRGGSLSPPFFRVQQGRAQSMTSPLFLKRSSFSVFTSSRARTGDPEALLSPHRFNSQRE